MPTHCCKLLQQTLPLALGQFKGEHSLDIPLILTVLVLSVLPMLILFIVFQDKLVKGMMAGAVKAKAFTSEQRFSHSWILSFQKPSSARHVAA